MRNPRVAAIVLFASSMFTGMLWQGSHGLLPWWIRYPALALAPFVAAAAIDRWHRTYRPAVPEWLAEVLHVVWGFGLREHQKGTLTPLHALSALDDVPVGIRRAARVGYLHGSGPGVLGRSRGSEPGA